MKAVKTLVADDPALQQNQQTLLKEFTRECLRQAQEQLPDYDSRALANSIRIVALFKKKGWVLQNEASLKDWLTAWLKQLESVIQDNKIKVYPLETSIRSWMELINSNEALDSPIPKIWFEKALEESSQYKAKHFVHCIRIVTLLVKKNPHLLNKHQKLSTNFLTEWLNKFSSEVTLNGVKTRYLTESIQSWQVLIRPDDTSLHESLRRTLPIQVQGLIVAAFKQLDKKNLPLPELQSLVSQLPGYITLLHLLVKAGQGQDTEIKTCLQRSTNDLLPYLKNILANVKKLNARGLLAVLYALVLVTKHNSACCKQKQNINFFKGFIKDWLQRFSYQVVLGGWEVTFQHLEHSIRNLKNLIIYNPSLGITNTNLIKEFIQEWSIRVLPALKKFTAQQLVNSFHSSARLLQFLSKRIENMDHDATRTITEFLKAWHDCVATQTSNFNQEDQRIFNKALRCWQSVCRGTRTLKKILDSIKNTVSQHYTPDHQNSFFSAPLENSPANNRPLNSFSNGRRQ